MERDLIIWPNRILVKPTFPVTEFNKELDDLVADMFKIMEKYGGVGLAAPQVGVRKSIIVYNCDGEKGVLINPELTPIEDAATEETGEGCLSFPGVYVKIERPNIFELKWQDQTGKVTVDEFYGFLAIAIQHELDHLEGKTLVQYLSKLKRDLVTRKMRKLQKKRELLAKRTKELKQYAKPDKDEVEAETAEAEDSEAVANTEG